MFTVKQSIVQRVLSVPELPTLPDVMSRILSAADDAASSAADLTEILSSDPAISARVLRLANSPFYGTRYEVDTIQRAVVTIGFEAVKQLALATSVLHTFDTEPARGFDARDFWLHSLGAGRAARLLTTHCRATPAAEACFSAAVLHDFGKYLFALASANQYPDLIEESRQTGRPLRELEDERFQITHDALGAWLLERWSFPAVIVEGIACQYHPERHEGPNHQSICVLALCSGMAREAGLGMGCDFGPVTHNAHAMSRLGLDEKHMTELIEMLRSARGEAVRALEAMRP